jgi:hypothetical protein
VLPDGKGEASLRFRIALRIRASLRNRTSLPGHVLIAIGVHDGEFILVEEVEVLYR